MKISNILAKGSVIASNLYLASAAYAIPDDATSAGSSSTATEWIDGVSEGVDGSFKGWASDVINLAIGLAALVCVVVLIASGYTYITAAGDEGKIEKATKSLTYAIVGLVICFISVILVRFVLDNVLS